MPGPAEFQQESGDGNTYKLRGMGESTQAQAFATSSVVRGPEHGHRLGAREERTLSGPTPDLQGIGGHREMGGALAWIWRGRPRGQG